MLKSLRPLFLCLCFLHFCVSTRAQLVISEILAENEGTYLDEDKEQSDWIEIYNPTAAAVNLAGWSLTDDPLVLAKWQFPSTNIVANGYVVVFASGKNRRTPGLRLHTNFSLSAGGEYLALVKPDGKTIAFEFTPEFPQQNPNISYGLAGGSLTSLRFFATPTPGVANSAGQSDISLPPIFSLPGGPYTNGITLSLTAQQPNVTIRYSLNGSDPTATSTAYTAPISIANTTVVRAKAFATGLVPSVTVTRTYTMLGTDVMNFSSNLPVLVLSTFGIQPNETAAIKVSAMLIGTNGARAYLNGKPDFDGRGTIKIRGSSSTQFPKKSYAFEIQDELGLDRKVGLLGMPKESDWVLYAPYTDKTLIRDFLAYEWCNGIGTYAPRTRLIEVYVDASGGKLNQTDYVGVYVLIEKIKRGDNRVNIQELLPSQTTSPDVTGGYIFKKDRLDPGDVGFNTTWAGQFAYVEPKEQQLVTAQKNYLSSYLSQFETALHAANFATTRNYTNYYDVAAGVDHHLMVEACKNIDGYRLSTFVHKDRLGKIAMGPIWDYNLTLGNANYNDGSNTANWYYTIYQGDLNQYPWYAQLFLDPDFKQAWIDRWGEIRRGTFATTNALPRVIQIANVLAESAARNYQKWPILGSYVWPNPDGYNLRTTYRSEIDWMTNWIAGRWAWMDSQSQRIPPLSRTGGIVTAGTKITISTNNLAVYYTIDGSDPRLPGGAISTKAARYTQPIAINNNTRIIARTLNGSTWSAPSSATYLTDTPQLAITEIMFNPGADQNKDSEFLELKNIGANTVDLKGYQISGGINFTFTNSTLFPSGGILLVVKNLTAFAGRYGNSPNVVGQYDGSLNNAGERIVLQGPLHEPILDVTYNNAWFPVTDGYGFSLVLRDEHASSATFSSKESWRASANLGGSPGQDDPAASLQTVLINEIVTHTAPPDVDAIELYNSGSAPVDIGNWYLSDDRGAARKFKIPSPTIIPANGYVVFTENDFNKDPLSPTSFALSSDDDEVYFFSADAAGNMTGFSDGFAYGPAAAGVSFGRYVTSDGKVHYPAQTARTFGTVNAGPQIGPVVINEIRYSAAPYQPQYVELKNISSQPVNLFDPAHPTNTWQINGLDFTFPTNVTIAPQGLLLVVQNDPTRFRATNSVLNSVPIFGPFNGVLQSDGEMIQLLRPDAPKIDSDQIPMLVVDEVRYGTNAPWPFTIANSNQSIERINANQYGDDPANWRVTASATSPGLDTGDSYDTWRVANFTAAELNNASVSGPGADPDHDGQVNHDEFICGTDPKSAASVLRLSFGTTGPLTLQFDATANHTYTVYFRNSLNDGAWITSATYEASPSPHTIQIDNPQPGYYRVAVP